MPTDLISTVGLLTQHKDSFTIKLCFISDLYAPEINWYKNEAKNYFSAMESKTSLFVRNSLFDYIGMDITTPVAYEGSAFAIFACNICDEFHIDIVRVLGYPLEKIPTNNHFLAVFFLLSIFTGKSRDLLKNLYNIMSFPTDQIGNIIDLVTYKEDKRTKALLGGVHHQ